NCNLICERRYYIQLGKFRLYGGSICIARCRSSYRSESDRRPRRRHWGWQEHFAEFGATILRPHDGLDRTQRARSSRDYKKNFASADRDRFTRYAAFFNNSAREYRLWAAGCDGTRDY